MFLSDVITSFYVKTNVHQYLYLTSIEGIDLYKKDLIYMQQTDKAYETLFFGNCLELRF